MQTPELITAASGGGALLGSALTAWWQRKRAPAEIDSIIAQGSEKAVGTLMKTLAAETARADRAEAIIRDREAKIQSLEAKIDALQSALDSVRRELHSLRAPDVTKERNR